MNAQPPDIVTARRRYNWQALKPERADYGATYGLRGPHGSTFLYCPHGITAVGLWSGTRESFDSVRRELESLERARNNADADRRISAETFKQWLAESVR